MNFTQFLEDRNIRFWEDGKNVQKGWVNITCPFCHDHSNHGGYNLEGNYYHCWICGWHSNLELISNLENCDYGRAKKLIEEYSEDIPDFFQERPTFIQRPSEIKFPLGTSKITEIHKNYLLKRNFNPDYLENKYHLLGTGPVGKYSLRIIAPIIFRNKTVSYQGRDITGQANRERYKTCPKIDEVIQHKSILYNLDNCKEKWIIIVEGITDVWRLGDNSAATFGIQYSDSQIRLIVERYQKIFIIFDAEKDAQKKATSLQRQFSALGVESINIKLNNQDPANLSQDDANLLKRNIERGIV